MMKSEQEQENPNNLKWQLFKAFETHYFMKIYIHNIYYLFIKVKVFGTKR